MVEAPLPSVTAMKAAFLTTPSAAPTNLFPNTDDELVASAGAAAAVRKPRQKIAVVEIWQCEVIALEHVARCAEKAALETRSKSTELGEDEDSIAMTITYIIVPGCDLPACLFVASTMAPVPEVKVPKVKVKCALPNLADARHCHSYPP